MDLLCLVREVSLPSRSPSLSSLLYRLTVVPGQSSGANATGERPPTDGPRWRPVRGGRRTVHAPAAVGASLWAQIGAPHVCGAPDGGGVKSPTRVGLAWCVVLYA
ncbi:hypothetical protein NDU88_007469 [Pleurodeles waltl]|uniref:Uncharacterized protein n=1 Tax=Pleurodeles waltl TaxID=8319 RepID=A0AAV7SST8_PLEWA|nr:hypothetical protein NDU88_007469 [Pleurodeles waltl]